MFDYADIDDDNDGVLDENEIETRSALQYSPNGSSDLDISIGTNAMTFSSPNDAVKTSLNGGSGNGNDYLLYQEDIAVGEVFTLSFDAPVIGVDLAFAGVDGIADIGNFTVKYDDYTTDSNLSLELSNLPLEEQILVGDSLEITTISGYNAV